MGVFLEKKRFFEGILNKNGRAWKQNTGSQVLDMSLDTAHKTTEEKLFLSLHLGLIILPAESHLSDFPPDSNLMSTAHSSLAGYPVEVWDLQHLDQQVSSLLTYKVLFKTFSPVIMDVQVFFSAESYSCARTWEHNSLDHLVARSCTWQGLTRSWL